MDASCTYKIPKRTNSEFREHMVDCPDCSDGVVAVTREQILNFYAMYYGWAGTEVVAWAREAMNTHLNENPLLEAELRIETYCSLNGV